MGLMSLITITFLIYSPDVDENRPILAQERVFFDKYVMCLAYILILRQPMNETWIGENKYESVLLGVKGI